MATTTDFDAQVPVREGEYGSKVTAVEPGGIEYIPDRERHGNPIQLFWTWMSPNMEFATVFVGVLPIAVFGGGFWPTVFGVTLGSLMGSITHGVLSTMGPRFGVPQMVEGRASFGFLGNFLPAALSWLTASFGWFIVNSVSGTFALVTLVSVLNKNAVLSFPIAFVIVVVVQVIVAFIGHNLIHQFERIIFPYLTIVFGLATIVILAQAHPGLGFNAKAPVAFGGASGAFILAVFISFGYAIGWNPFASDYSRYLPRASNPRSVALAAGLGVFVSCAVLEIAGAAAATISQLGNNPTEQFTNPLPVWLQVLVLSGEHRTGQQVCELLAAHYVLDHPLAGRGHYRLRASPRTLSGTGLLRHRLGQLEGVCRHAGRNRRHHPVLGSGATNPPWLGTDQLSAVRRPQLLCRCDRRDHRLPGALSNRTTAFD